MTATTANKSRTEVGWFTRQGRKNGWTIEQTDKTDVIIFLTQMDPRDTLLHVHRVTHRAELIAEYDKLAPIMNTFIRQNTGSKDRQRQIYTTCITRQHNFQKHTRHSWWHQI